jgi:hypothetical protein
MALPAREPDVQAALFLKHLSLGGLNLPFAGLTGLLFDQPHVTKSAKEGWAAHHAGRAWGAVPMERVEFLGGSFFDGGRGPPAEEGGAWGGRPQALPARSPSPQSLDPASTKPSNLARARDAAACGIPEPAN